MPRLRRTDPLFIATLATLATLSIGCRSIDYVPLESGAYIIDELNTPPKLHGVTLDLDLQAGKATVADGVTKETLTITRIPDRERWHGSCGTMSGYSMLEPVRLSPTTFELVSQTWTFDTLHADCVRGMLRMITKDASGDRWIFRRK